MDSLVLSHPSSTPDVDSYEDIDVLQLVVFYNDGFGIQVGDQLSERKQKNKNLVDGTHRASGMRLANASLMNLNEIITHLRIASFRINVKGCPGDG